MDTNSDKKNRSFNPKKRTYKLMNEFFRSKIKNGKIKDGEKTVWKNRQELSDDINDYILKKHGENQEKISRSAFSKDLERANFDNEGKNVYFLLDDPVILLKGSEQSKNGLTLMLKGDWEGTRGKLEDVGISVDRVSIFRFSDRVIGLRFSTELSEKREADRITKSIEGILSANKLRYFKMIRYEDCLFFLFENKSQYDKFNIFITAVFSSII